MYFPAVYSCVMISLLLTRFSLCLQSKAMVSEGGQKHVAIMEQKGTTIRKPNRKKKPDVVSFSSVFKSPSGHLSFPLSSSPFPSLFQFYVS